MLKTKILTSVVGIAAIASVVAFALPASAQTVSATVSAKASASPTTIITRSNTEIAARIADLNKLNTRVAAMKNESATEKANISAQVSTNISGLTTLQAKIDADTDVTTARADEKTIFTTFRIYALVVPQGDILASADRVTTINSLMTALGTKIQTRITADQTAGKDVTALTAALSDMNAKIADAASQSQTAQSGVVSLTPDQGNTTVAASNKAALVAARADIKTSTSDLKAARADIKTILAGLKSLGGSASVTASTTAQ